MSGSRHDCNIFNLSNGKTKLRSATRYYASNTMVNMEKFCWSIKSVVVYNITKLESTKLASLQY
uniref:Uncharacterized protein n=1 Tax=Rhizophora mucronata TaxID=61149 RepID=A0A2P2QUL1_RHIMU